jgi:hypothetical protein
MKSAINLRRGAGWLQINLSEHISFRHAIGDMREELATYTGAYIEGRSVGFNSRAREGSDIDA